MDKKKSKTKNVFGVNSFRMVLLSGFFLAMFSLQAQQQNPSRIMLQGFWWGSWHDTYPGSYYDYLTRLAPRLRELGIDAIWVFPPQKAGQQEVKTLDPVGFTYPKFYESFDNYDLGDKYQKGSTGTRGGTKDEYLRMIAVMHANGIDVIQDVILNHNSIGGPFMLTPLNGALDPAAPIFDPSQPQQEKDFQQSKNYRYVCYATPAGDESATDYSRRTGRWPKNWENFHPDQSPFNVHPCPDPSQPLGDNVCKSIFGFNIHDFCIYSAAVGQSSNAVYNPVQPNNYMYDEMAKWLVWFKKQSGFDGVRLDAVKHIETGLVLGLMNELQNNAGWASGGSQMFAVGELIDSKQTMDNWVAVQEGQRCGTFDFSLRDGIYQMIDKKGFFDMYTLPAFQQNERARTVPVVNNHDSFRPVINPSNGIYSDYKSGGPYLAPIDPDDPWLAPAYAVACAVDGTPDIFIEDLFKLNTGTRYTHDPQNTSQLQTRDKIANIIWAHQVMDWKSFPFKVRTAAIENPAYVQLNGGDLLVIEREGRALITVNDNGANDGQVWVNCGFNIGTQLHDYSGHFPDVFVQGPVSPGLPNRVLLNIPRVDIANGKHGYGIWAPTNFINAVHNPTPRSTTQEWEMADDLGDSHPLSLKQGGRIPDWGIWYNPRTVGRIFSDAGTPIQVEVYPTKAGKPTGITLALYSSDGTLVSNVTSTAPVLNLTAPQVGYYTIKVWNGQFNSTGQRVYVKATYTAPQVVDPLLYNFGNSPSEAKAPENTELDGISISAYPNPSTDGADIAIRYSLSKERRIRLTVFDPDGKPIATLEDGVVKEGTYEKMLRTSDLREGTYIYRLEADESYTTGRIEILR